MKSLLTIWMLVILTSIGLTVISGNALAQKDPRGGPQIAQQDPRVTTQQGQFQHPEFGKTNDWGEVVSGNAQGGSFGQHSSNPIPDPAGTPPQEIDRETPRDGVGNVQLNENEIPKHPAFHASALCQAFPNAAGCSNID